LAETHEARIAVIENAQIAHQIGPPGASKEGKVCVVTIDQPITNESFRKRVFNVHIGVGKKQTGKRRRSTYRNVLTIYPEFPTLITSVNRERDRKMRQVFEQLVEPDIDRVDDSLYSTLPRETRHPPRNTDADFKWRRCLAPGFLDERRFLRASFVLLGPGENE